MNMHGVITPVYNGPDIDRRTLPNRAWAWVRERRMFMAMVVLPTLIVAGYLFLIASDQYESEVHFLVRRADVQTMPGTGVSQALSMVTGVSAAQNEAMSVADYLTSHDVVDTLRDHDRLVERFRDTGADFFSRLRQANPTPEKLLKYYRQQVKVHHNTETGITTLDVRSFLCHRQPTAAAG
jgi:capsular polysaccharide transport system permease protein